MEVEITKNESNMLVAYKLIVSFYEDYMNSNSVFTFKNLLTDKKTEWHLKNKSGYKAHEEAVRLIPRGIKSAPKNFTRCSFLLSGQDHNGEWWPLWSWNTDKKGKITKTTNEEARIFNSLKPLPF